jgi:hypothetical protein
VTKLSADGKSLIYSTYIGGIDWDYGNSIDVENGYAYVTGMTASPNFPTFNAYDTSFNGISDVFVTKLDLNGSVLVYSTFLGGSDIDEGYGIAVEGGYAYVTGETNSADFPNRNAYNSTYGGNKDCFVTKFGLGGNSIIYSTFLGTTQTEYGNSIAVEERYAYVAGTTTSSEFPIINAYDATHNGGTDIFITKFGQDGRSLVYSTFLGGSNNEWVDGIAVEEGFACVVGSTLSSNFPTANVSDSSYHGSTDCIVTKFAQNGQNLVYSTYLGGTDNDYGRGIAIERGYVYVTGYTASEDFPTINAIDTVKATWDDCFVTKFAVSVGEIIYSTFIGGMELDQTTGLAVENGYTFITGRTQSLDYPIRNAYDSTFNDVFDCFITVLVEDSDQDGLSDQEEEDLGTDPFCIDTDNDNFLDSYEILYGSNATDPFSFPAIPQAWFDEIYENLEGNATLIQNLIAWSAGNASLIETVMYQLDENSTLLYKVISWLDGNHTAIEVLFTYLNGNATLLMLTVNSLNGNVTRINLLSALVSQNIDHLQSLDASMIGNITEIRSILDQLGVTVGDSDYDGLDDLDELVHGTDIQCIDTDCDNLNDAFEIKLGTDPLDDDSDQDSYYDGYEVLMGTDPLDPEDYPGSGSTTTVTIPTTSTTPQPEDSSLLLVILAISGVGIVVTSVIVVIVRKQRMSS